MKTTSRTPDRDALRLIAEALAPYLLECIGVSAPPEAAEIDLALSLAGKRRAYAAARSGEIAGAKKVARHWYAPRAAHDEWLESITIRAPKTDKPSSIEAPQSAPTSLESMRARLGLKRVG